MASSQKTECKELNAAELEGVFNLADKNGDGFISESELAHLLRVNMGRDLSDAAIKTIFCDVDLDGDGMITLKEFVLEMTKPNRKRAFEEAFKRFDKDGNGVLCRQEVECLCREVGSYSEADIQKIINSADKNKDGRIDKGEFMALV